MKQDIRTLRGALMDITGLLNRPQQDAALLHLAGASLERALFPLLVRIEANGPLGIGELADLCGRDYTTVSRQVARLEQLGLVARRTNSADARIKEALVTGKGRRMTRAIDGAREETMLSLLRDWDKRDIAQLARLLRKLADDAMRFARE